MSRAFPKCVPAVAVLAALLWPVAEVHADPAAAERQYRIARRLAAEGSAEAAAALRKVAELDPGGVLADDALLEEALLERIPTWPHELGDLSGAAWKRAEPLLRRIVDEMPGADRTVEARYRLALLRMEPRAGQDLSGARLDLLAVATMPAAGKWPVRARYVIAWLDFQRGELQRAEATFLRLLVDHPESEVAGRSRIGLARLWMRDGRFGDAAALLQQVVEAGGDDGGATPLRELAVRGALRGAGAGGRWSDSAPAGAVTALKSISAAVAVPGGQLVLADRKRGQVLRLRTDGVGEGRWQLDEPQAVCVDPLGRILIAAGENVFRIGGGDGPRRIASLGRYLPVGSIAADGSGVIWVVDRRGDKIGRIAPGAASPEPFWEGRDARVKSIVWDGVRLLAADEKGGRVLEIGSGGNATTVAGQGLQKPASISADPAGQFAVLDDRTQEVILFAPDGAIRDRIAAGSVGSAKPQAVALAEDGSLFVTDGSGARFVRVP